MAFTESIENAARFLTRPLILAVSPVRVAALQVVLRSTLHAACTGAPLILPFAPNRLPPRPVYAAAIGAGVSWADWMSLLAPREFALVITPCSIRAEYVGLRPHTVVIWADRTPAPASAPSTKWSPATRPATAAENVRISKFGQQLQATVASARARAQTRTLAQQLLDATHDADTAELFGRLARSHAGILSPSPTRATFSPTGVAPRVPFASLPSPLSAPAPRTPSPTASSRPSSRSSMFSDGEESVSSVSSVAECDAIEVKAAAPPAGRVFVAPHHAPVSFVPGARARAERASQTLPLVPLFVEEPETTSVVINANKKDITKYLYQGGVSTVLTGGVMLGAAPTAKSAPVRAAIPHYRAPTGVRATRHTQNIAATSSSWRIAAARA